MLVDRIILKLNKKFSNSITPWATSNCNDLVQLADKNLDIISIDSLLIFNQNQILSQDVSDLRAQFDKLQKPILHIDDIFDKLDESRVAKIVEMVNSDTFGQLFISDTHPERTESIVKSTHQTYKIFNL